VTPLLTNHYLDLDLDLESKGDMKSVCSVGFRGRTMLDILSGVSSTANLNMTQFLHPNDTV
jgi:hypothetical protein